MRQRLTALLHDAIRAPTQHGLQSLARDVFPHAAHPSGVALDISSEAIVARATVRALQARQRHRLHRPPQCRCCRSKA